MNRKQSWNLTTLFILLIFGFCLASMLKPVSEFSEKENRKLAQMPAITAESIFSGSFEKDYEDYLTDQFLFRDTWIGLKTRAEALIGKKDTNGVYLGRDGYLIEMHEGVFTADLAEQNAESLASFAELCASKWPQTRLHVMIVPNAVDILRDKLPAFASPYDEEIYLGHLRDMLPADVWFDASAVLKQHSQEEIFYRTDHHWETLGAYYVFETWARERLGEEIRRDEYDQETVSTSFEGTVAAKTGAFIHPDTIELMRPVREPSVTLTYNRSDDIRSTPYQMSALETRDQYNVFFGGNNGLIEGETDAGGERKVLVIKDSYAHCFVPFLYGIAAQADMLDLRYYNQNLSLLIDEKGYTDILLLYNAAGFAADTSLGKLLL